LKVFDFVILFLSFIYTLGLTHLLFAATRMIRHRRSLTFSWPHALWMLAALGMLFGNWLSLWDFHALEAMPLSTFFGGFALVVVQYTVCALVAPELEAESDFDLRRFHEREGRSYLLAFLATMLLSLALNAAAGAGLGIQNWASQNAIVLAMIASITLALTVKSRWAQVIAPLSMVGLMIAFPIIYYPTLK
jgi:hypothetical protein